MSRKRPVGRPRLPAKVRLDTQVFVRCTKAEKRAAMAAARKLGGSVSEILRGAIIALARSGEVPAQLKHISINPAPVKR